MALTAEQLRQLGEDLARDVSLTEQEIRDSAERNAEQYGFIATGIAGQSYAIAGSPAADLLEATGRTHLIVETIPAVPQSSWQAWLDELNNVVGGISIPSLSGLLSSLSGIGSAILAPVMIVFQALSDTIATIKEFISNLASNIAEGMESAFGVIGTIVIDPLLGILSAFGDYLGDKLSAFIEYSIGEG